MFDVCSSLREYHTTTTTNTSRQIWIMFQLEGNVWSSFMGILTNNYKKAYKYKLRLNWKDICVVIYGNINTTTTTTNTSIQIQIMFDGNLCSSLREYQHNNINNNYKHKHTNIKTYYLGLNEMNLWFLWISIQQQQHTANTSIQI